MLSPLNYFSVFLSVGPGVTSLGSGGFIPYPGYDYFRNDLWYYDLENRTWVEEVPEEGYPVPDARQDAIFLLLGDLIFMHGKPLLSAFTSIHVLI